MKGSLSLKQLLLDVWLIEQLRNAPEGISLEQLQIEWQCNPSHEGVLSRATMTRHREMIKGMFGLDIRCTDQRHYRITNPEQLALNTLANDLLASMYEYLFLDEYRDLGPAIQPQKITIGREYLRPIGDAIRHHRKLKVRYQKFSDDAPYDCILHPYCLRACLDRWYVLAVKEGSSHPVQTFALDRTLSLSVLEDTYEVNPAIDVKNYFHDSFSIWAPSEEHPVQDILIAVPKWVVKYWRTLPLHHSQRELIERETEKESVFSFHIATTPEFYSELKKWDAVVLEQE